MGSSHTIGHNYYKNFRNSRVNPKLSAHAHLHGIFTSMLHQLQNLEQDYLFIQINHMKNLSTPWGIWIVHWTIIETILLCQMLCTINQCHSICWHIQVLYYPYFIAIYHTIGLSKSVSNIHYFHTAKHTVSFTITWIWR